MVLGCCKDITSYYVILNKVGKKVKAKLTEDTKKTLDVLLDGGVKISRLPTDILVIDNIAELAEEDDAFLPDASEVTNFVSSAKSIEIRKENVHDLQVEVFDQMATEIENLQSIIKETRKELELAGRNYEAKIAEIEKNKVPFNEINSNGL